MWSKWVFIIKKSINCIYLYSTLSEHLCTLSGTLCFDLHLKEGKLLWWTSDLSRVYSALVTAGYWHQWHWKEERGIDNGLIDGWIEGKLHSGIALYNLLNVSWTFSELARTLVIQTLHSCSTSHWLVAACGNKELFTVKTKICCFNVWVIAVGAMSVKSLEVCTCSFTYLLISSVCGQMFPHGYRRSFEGSVGGQEMCL